MSEISDGEPITIKKLDTSGRELLRYEGQIVMKRGNCVLVKAAYLHPDLEMPGLTFNTGDTFYEVHCSDSWFNVFEVRSGGEEVLKGWYCNITRPAVVEDGQVRAVDLAHGSLHGE